MRRILIIGANGFIGEALLHGLQAAGHQVCGCVRSAARWHSDSPAVEADYTRHDTVEQWLPLVRGFDVVINAVGIIREQGNNSFAQVHTHGPIALFDAAVQAGVKSIVQISALGSDSGATTPFHLSKRAADDHLASSRLDWLILRPSLVYGHGSKSAALFKALATLPLIPVAGGGEQPVQPVAIDDLVRIVVAFVEGQIQPCQRIDVGGAQVISFREMLACYRHWLGLKPPCFIAIPERLALWVAHQLGWFGIAAPSRETVALLRHGNRGDVSRLIEQTRITPLTMVEGLQRSPAQQADRWHARLYLLHPALRVSLALMWIWTALVSAGLYPLEESMTLLAAVGLTGTKATAVLVVATLLDLLLGAALLLRHQVKSAAWLQIMLITGYSLIITIALPDFWLHPFGPLSKNLPLIVATLMLSVMEE